MDTEEEKGVASETDVTVSEYQKTSLSDLIGNWVSKDLDLYLRLIFRHGGCYTRVTGGFFKSKIL